MKKIICFTIIIIMAAAVSGQDPVCRVINNHAGLASNTVYSLLQDSLGYIWMGHDKGLSRFDGARFEHYAAASQQGKSMTNLVEVSGRVWCQDFSGNFYFASGRQLQPAGPVGRSNYAPAGLVAGNRLVVADVDSLRIIHPRATSLRLPDNAKNQSGTFFDGQRAWFFGKQHLQVFDGNTIENVLPFQTLTPCIYFLVRAGGRFYGFSKNNAPYVYDISAGVPLNVSGLKPGIIIQEVSICGDEIWVSTTTGAFCFDVTMRPKYDGHCFFAGNKITRVLKDRESNYWFGTTDKGVLLVPNIHVRLYRYGNDGITALAPYQDGASIIAGTAAGRLLRFDDRSPGFLPLNGEVRQHEISYLYYDPLMRRTVICADNVLFDEKGIVKTSINLSGKNLVPFNKDFYAVAYSGGIGLLRRNQSGTAAPDWLPDLHTETPPYLWPLVSDVRGRAVCYDSGRVTLYASSALGLHYFSPQGRGRITANGQPVYAAQIIMYNGLPYAATFSGGLYVIKNGKAVSQNQQQPALMTGIYKMAAGDSCIWLAGDEKLQQYLPESGRLITYNAADGLPAAELKDLLVRNGVVYMATSEGLVIFNGQQGGLNRVAPRLLLTGFLVNGVETNAVNKLSLAAGENNLQVNFSLLAFKGGAFATAEYRINNGPWLPLEAQARSLRLPSLSPGGYTLTIRAFNEDGVATAENIVIQFRIAAPLYRRWWFLALVGGAALCAMYLYFRGRLRSEKRRNELQAQKIVLEQELRQSMLSSIKSQMNPHFLFNALNTIQSYIYTNDKENASRYLGKFSELTRLILDMSNKEVVSLADEIKALELYVELEQLRFEDKLQYTITVAPGLSPETVSIPSMLIQPYVENAVKHGLLHLKGPWLLQILFERQPHGIRVTVDDNGVGRKISGEINRQKNRHHQSFATGANQKRLELLNRGLQDTISAEIIDKVNENGGPAGTRVVLHIPFSKPQKTVS